jgi:hypothetical protein
VARIKKNKILGSLKDFTIYEIDGKIVVARKGGFSKKQFNEAENLDGHRKRGTEFKFCSHMSKMIRHSLHDYHYMFKRRISANFTSQLQLVCKNDDEGALGQRKLDVKNYGHLLEGYALSPKAFSALSLIPFVITVSADRDYIKLTIPSFLPLVRMSPPPGTNNFKIHMTATLVNKFEFDQEKQAYYPELGKGYVFSKTIESESYNNTEPVESSQLEIDFGFVPDPTYGLIICLAIEFVDSFTSRVLTNNDWSVMKIAKVA